MTIREIFGFRVPTPWALKGSVECSNPDLMMGVELEVENCEHSQDWYQDRTGKLGWTTTVDNSLRGTNISTGGNAGIGGAAFEFISKPMRASTLLYSMEEFFNVTKFNDANYTDRCSVHVHVNCTDLTPDQVSSVALVYSVVEEILFRFVGAGRENNIYCLPWSQCRMNHDMVDKITQDVNGLARRWQKYTALNLIPLRSQGTVEFRQMHGTADMKKLTTWINLIGCIFKYGTNTELTELIKEIKALNSTSEYEVFFGRVLGNYLPYTEDYRASLEGGIISAKYGLINWKKDRKAPKEEGAYPADYVIMDDIEDMDEEAPRARPGPAPVNRVPNRFIPWPDSGERFSILSLTDVERTYITTGDRANLWFTNSDGEVVIRPRVIRPAPAPAAPVRAERPGLRPARVRVDDPATWVNAGPRLEPGQAIQQTLYAIRARTNNQEGEF